MHLRERPGAEGNADRSFERALRFVEYRPRSRGETEQRLKRWGYDDATRLNVLNQLEDLGLLNDREFARVYLNEMLRKGFGCRRVSAELVKKKIEREIIDEVMAEYPHGDELARAIEVAGSAPSRYRFGGQGSTDNKLIAYLMRRGFSGDVARRAAGRVDSVDTNYCQE